MVAVASPSVSAVKVSVAISVAVEPSVETDAMVKVPLFDVVLVIVILVPAPSRLPAASLKMPVGPVMVSAFGVLSAKVKGVPAVAVALEV